MLRSGFRGIVPVRQKRTNMREPAVWRTTKLRCAICTMLCAGLIE